MPVLAWIAAAAASPAGQKLLGIAADAVARWLERRACALETRAAVKQAKAATTAEALRDASRKLSDASNRPGP